MTIIYQLAIFPPQIYEILWLLRKLFRFVKHEFELLLKMINLSMWHQIFPPPLSLRANNHKREWSFMNICRNWSDFPVQQQPTETKASTARGSRVWKWLKGLKNVSQKIELISNSEIYHKQGIWEISRQCVYVLVAFSIKATYMGPSMKVQNFRMLFRFLHCHCPAHFKWSPNTLIKVLSKLRTSHGKAKLQWLDNEKATKFPNH